MSGNISLHVQFRLRTCSRNLYVKASWAVLEGLSPLSALENTERVKRVHPYSANNYIYNIEGYQICYTINPMLFYKMHYDTFNVVS